MSAFDQSPVKMVGGTPLSPPLGGGAVVPPVPVPVPVDMVVGVVVGTVVGGAVVDAGVIGTMCPVAGGSTVEVRWVVVELELGRVVVFWEGLGGSALMAAVGWKSGCCGSEGSQYPRPKLLVTAIRELALVKNTLGWAESV